jgi:hypothetical protein
MGVLQAHLRVKFLWIYATGSTRASESAESERVGAPETGARRRTRRGWPRVGCGGPLPDMSPFHRVDVLHDGSVVRIQRSQRPYQSAAELNQERLLLGEMLDKLGRTGRGLLIDSRVAPHSTDALLQGEFHRFRVEVARGFDRVAALVRSKVGILQVHRLVTDSVLSNVQAFDDEAAAIAHLLGPPGALGPRVSSRPR